MQTMRYSASSTTLRINSNNILEVAKTTNALPTVEKIVVLIPR